MLLLPDERPDTACRPWARVSIPFPPAIPDIDINVMRSDQPCTGNTASGSWRVAAERTGTPAGKRFRDACELGLPQLMNHLAPRVALSYPTRSSNTTVRRCKLADHRGSPRKRAARGLNLRICGYVAYRCRPYCCCDTAGARGDALSFARRTQQRPNVYAWNRRSPPFVLLAFVNAAKPRQPGT